jgi:hypothetical protein
MEDDKIESFFREMKASDRHLVVPPFPKQREPRKLLPIFMYAAAAVIALLIAVLYFMPQPVNDLDASRDVVILVGQDNLKSQSLIDAGQETLSDWESPTSFLSEDY